jgi:hypothetical protein
MAARGKETSIMIQLARSSFRYGVAGGVHTEGTGSARRLNGLVETGEAGEGERVVGESGHDPVDESLVASIAKEVCRMFRQ